MKRTLAGAMLVALFVGVVAAQEPADATTALADYRAGRHQVAYERFASALEAAGDSAPGELRWNTALAALRVQRSGDAEAVIAPWLDGVDRAQRADAEFVVGLASAQRAERAATAARLPDAEPMAWTMAVQSMERAVGAFARAAMLRGDWPEAVRNAERAQRALADLKQQRDAAKPPESKPEQPLPPPPPPAPSPGPEEAAVEPVLDALRPTEIAQLLQRLEQKDREKRNVRRAESQAAVVAGERAW